jgi:hypothetical protein
MVINMSYCIGIYVKIEGCNKYAEIAYPDYSSPSYNLGKLFRACMDWNFRSIEYYRCDYAIEHLDKGIKELAYNPNKYAKLIPPLSLGTPSSALNTLDSIRGCILEQAEDIPLECLYMRWE